MSDTKKVTPGVSYAAALVKTEAPKQSATPPAEKSSKPAPIPEVTEVVKSQPAELENAKAPAVTAPANAEANDRNKETNGVAQQQTHADSVNVESKPASAPISQEDPTDTTDTPTGDDSQQEEKQSAEENKNREGNDASGRGKKNTRGKGRGRRRGRNHENGAPRGMNGMNGMNGHSGPHNGQHQHHHENGHQVDAPAHPHIQMPLTTSHTTIPLAFHPAMQVPIMPMSPPAMSPSREQSAGTPEMRAARDSNNRRSRDLFPVGTYKTEICRSHLNSGFCEYGDNCQFAHGIQELRPRHFDVKYKTQLCKNYHKDGHCRFGSRCKFIHDEHRIQVDQNEFWLVSPSENLVRVEIVDNPMRRAQLQALVDHPPPPPPGSSNPSVEERKRAAMNIARVAASRAAATRGITLPHNPNFKHSPPPPPHHTGASYNVNLPLLPHGNQMPMPAPHPYMPVPAYFHPQHHGHSHPMYSPPPYTLPGPPAAAPMPAPQPQ